MREPFPGWIDNWGGTTLFAYMAAKGVLRNINLKGDILTDLVPADLVSFGVF
jgi:hypothetical protein